MRISELIKTPQLYVGMGSGAAAAAAVALLIPGVLPIAAGAAGVIGFAAGLMGSSFERKEKDDGVEVAELDNTTTLPDELKSQMQRLRQIARLHAKSDSPLFELINGILENSQELFRRINSKLESQAHRMAAVNYTDTLTKLNKALDTDYYLDIKKNPRLWDNTQARLEAVERAVRATDLQLIRNIQQVNASQDIEYEISLDSLTNSMDGIPVDSLIEDSKN